MSTMQTARKVLTPEALAMLQTIADTGSFAAAARALGMVPSALTYRVRQMEDALDVLLFDRSSRQAVATLAGLELLREGERLLRDIDAVANRVKRVATGWEPQFTIAVDAIIAKATVMELCEHFLESAPPTRIRLRDETLSGTLEALTSGQADLALGVSDMTQNPGLHGQLLGEVRFVFVVAPHHPLASSTQPLCDEELRKHRAIAVADTVSRGRGMSIGLLGGQDVLTVATMQDKLDAHIRGLGCGFLPESLVQDHIATGRLVERATVPAPHVVSLNYAWRISHAAPGRALQWWLDALGNAATRAALLHRHRGV
jgi:DNA-binding transcriptional LysR family regulator